jgi:hypothetical protein
VPSLRLINSCLALVVILSGCASSDQPTRYVDRSTSVPPALLEPCKPTTPITKDEYISRNMDERETYLALYSMDLLKDVRLCNDKLTGLKKLNLRSHPKGDYSQ